MNVCPCCSGKAYEDCCGPFLSREQSPPSAEALMRSRYTAYVRADLDYLFETSGPAVQKEFDVESTRKWAESAQWHGLEILSVSGGGEADQRGEVEFLARYEVDGRSCNHHESAEFLRMQGTWRFLDGKVIGPPPFRREDPKIGRNDPCRCGSAKKFKRCCEGKATA